MLPSGLQRFTADITPFFFFLLTVVTLGTHQFGFHLAELNAPQDVITCRKPGLQHDANTTAADHHRTVYSLRALISTSLSECIPMGEAAFATASSVFTVGGLLGALAAGTYCSRYGRLAAMRGTAIIFLIGSAIETLSTSVASLAVGRVLNGISAGASTVIVPLYISEVAPVKSRGFFGYFTQITVNVGILFTQTLGFFLSHGSAWRLILSVGIVLAITQFMGLLAIPESPAWLVVHRGDVVQARRILQQIRGHCANLDDEISQWPARRHVAASSTTVVTIAATASAEEQSLLDQTRSNPNVIDDDVGVTVASPSLTASLANRKPVGFWQVLRDPLYRPAVLAVIGIMFAQQTCGINSVVMYSVSLLNGVLPVNSALLSIIISATNLITTMLCAPLPDRLGRRMCLMLSIVGQGTSAFVLALSIVYSIKFMSALAVLAFVAFFAVGLGPVPFLLSSELVGQEAVGATQSWALGANYVATFLVAQFFPLINTALNTHFGGAGWVFFLFSLFAILAATFVLVYVPETNGKKDIAEVWGRTEHID